MTKFLSHFGKLWDAISSNVLFLLEFVGIIAAIFVIAYVVERAIKKRNNDTGKILTTRKVAVIGVMSAISGILMCFEIPLWFAPPFYKLDFSELPVLICGFAFGPVAGERAEARARADDRALPARNVSAVRKVCLRRGQNDR